TVRARRAERVCPSASRRSCRSPRSGSGVTASQSRSSGRSCCMRCERRGGALGGAGGGGGGGGAAVEPGGGARPARGGGGRARECAVTGERVEHRREEHALVDGAHARTVGHELCFELLECAARAAVAVPEHTRQSGARVERGGDRVRLLLVDELQAVLHGAQP